MTVRNIITGILEREGSTYTNDPKDSGGPTKYGITQAVLSSWRGVQVTPEAVKALTEAEAQSIYYKRYVLDPGFGPIVELSIAVAEEVIDTGVNMGVARAAEFLQRCLNAFNRGGSDYPDVKVDGNCGVSTVAALQAYLRVRGESGVVVLLRALNALQGEFYVSLAERRPKDEAYCYGWFLNRVS